jgi:hypothetical protein
MVPKCLTQKCLLIIIIGQFNNNDNDISLITFQDGLTVGIICKVAPFLAEVEYLGIIKIFAYFGILWSDVFE